MNTIQTYLYTQKVEVQFWDASITTKRNSKVYARKIKVYQGIDNPVQFFAKNQDQRPVDLTGARIQADIQDPVQQLTIASLGVTILDPIKGVGYFVIDSTLANSLAGRQYKITFKTTNLSTAREFPLYTDYDANVPVDLIVEDAYYSTSYPDSGEEEIIIDGGTI